MTQTYNGRPELDYFLVIAQSQRAEAMAHTAYLVIDGIGRGASATLGAIARGGRALAGTVAARRRRRAALRALQALDDRLLLDIGLTRADLWAVSNGTQLMVTDETWQLPAVAPIDIALSEAAIRGCNDNGMRRRVA